MTALRSFRNDYSEGAHPRVLEALVETNLDQTIGYTGDEHCAHARQLIREAAQAPDARVEFVVGGTQANSLVIAAALRPHEAVIAATTGHIAVHETGSVEASGHKVVVVPSSDGLLRVPEVRTAFEAHDSCHMVKPRLLYVSDSSEVGTIYTRGLLEDLRAFADEHDMLLFLDGARLAVAFAAEGSDLTLPDLARLCDAFTIGGTKNGALFGEAIVITDDALKVDFDYLMKQRGAMLAKGRLLGVQYETLFTGGLYWELGRHADEQALRLKAGLAARGFRFQFDSPTNQQFVVMPDALASTLMELCSFEPFGKVDATHTAVRLVTSWATPAEAVDDLLAWIDANAGTER